MPCSNQSDDRKHGKAVKPWGQDVLHQSGCIKHETGHQTSIGYSSGEEVAKRHERSDILNMPFGVTPFETSTIPFEDDPTQCIICT